MGALDGRVAIVTGAGRGLGRAHALLLAEEGAKVVVNDLGGTFDGLGSDTRPAKKVVDEILAGGGEAVANYDDVSEWKGGRRIVQTALDAFGALHVLVNNAGIARSAFKRYLIDIAEDDWDSMIDVHLKGHFVVLHHAGEYWRARSEAGEDVRASVINTSSPSGFVKASEASAPTQAHYCVAKAGILALTSCAATELRPYGVRVNAIAPGARTRLTERSMPDVVAAPDEPGAFDKFDPANVSPMVAWLATEGCPVTGRVFKVFGSTIEPYEGWSPTGMIDKPSRWTVEELDIELKRLAPAGS